MVRARCLLMCVLLAATACGNGDAGDATTGRSTTTAPPAVTTAPPPAVGTTPEPAPATTLGRLPELGAAVPSESELEGFMEVADLIVAASGGPGDPGFISERADLANLVGGYHLMFRTPDGGADSGWLSLVLFASAADAAAVADAIRVGNDPDTAGSIRAEFDVSDMLSDGEGVVHDPEPGSHVTTIVGSSGPVVVSFLVSHGPDDDRIEAARSVVFEVCEWLGGLDL